MSFRSTWLTALLLLAAPATFAATRGGPIPVPLPLFPANNWWNTDITNAPADPGSANYISFIGNTRQVHPDFGGDDGEGGVYGIPYIIVDGTQPKKTVDFVLYPGQSDGVGLPFYPIPDEAATSFGWVEGGPPGNVDIRDDQDRHILIVDKTNNHLYELYNTWFNGTNWEAGSGAFFDMNANQRRPEGWTSADASGMAILPGLVRYDEVFGPDEIRHAFRVTVRATNGYVYPASHVAGSTTNALPMGARLRLRPEKNISGYPAALQKIFRAMKRYGLIVADNGSDMYVSGAYDTNWDNGVLNPAFHSLKASDFEVIQLGWKPTFTVVLALPPTVGSGDPTSATLTVYDANGNVATGYRGTVHFTATDGSATLPVDYTFTAGDAGVHVFSSGFILRAIGSHVVTVTDAATPTITGSDGVTVGPAAPTNFTATRSGPTSIALTWTGSAGAVQYEIARRCTSTGYAPIATTSATSFGDTVPVNSACVYQVRALDAMSRVSPYSAPDVATTFAFTDDPLIAGSTRIKFVHVDELRQAVNALRATAGLGAMSFTAPAPAAGTTIRATHLQELRTALLAARNSLSLSAFAFTDPSLVPGVRVKAVHVQELRGGVQ